MTYEELLSQASSENLLVKEVPLLGSDGRIYNNRIAIRKDIPTLKQKSCVLAEELGHYYTGVGNILEQNSINNIKQERYGRIWAYNHQIGRMGIRQSYLAKCRTLYDMAEYLEVTEEFLIDALQYYKSKYGTFTEIDNYIIYFEPVIGVFEKYK